MDTGLYIGGLICRSEVDKWLTHPVLDGVDVAEELDALPREPGGEHLLPVFLFC